MARVKWLGVLPFVGILGGPFVFNQVEPLVLGMPLLLAWLAGCVLATSGIMAVIYACDPDNAHEEPDPAGPASGDRGAP